MNHKHDPEIGATNELCLRVSVATLVRVLFENSRDGELILALECKATLHKTESGHIVEAKSQPFGGTIRILDLNTVRDLIGDFHFDSEHSRAEQDFRIFIRPSDWTAVREFCIEHLNRVDDPLLETGPARELVKEFADTLKINLKPDQYTYQPLGFVIENHPVPTDNVHVQGPLTVRLYRIFEVHMLDNALCKTMLSVSQRDSDQDLRGLALKDLQNGGNGRANSIVALPLRLVVESFLALPPESRYQKISIENHELDESVMAILKDVPVPQYQRI